MTVSELETVRASPLLQSFPGVLELIDEALGLPSALRAGAIAIEKPAGKPRGPLDGEGQPQVSGQSPGVTSDQVAPLGRSVSDSGAKGPRESAMSSMFAFRRGSLDCLTLSDCETSTLILLLIHQCREQASHSDLDGGPSRNLTQQQPSSPAPLPLPAAGAP